ncbi:lysozyme inhibitor LprI family protein [Acidithiobacillus concretivorus]|uniref:Lysozyme inhibitor LprI N-terminal domain-containing protein n=1 Tax=Acidithiobacillus concretivorus TaxID=3063952 RepID=A0ABS5ZNW5_9PROT|nr:hypothetical protein [Acidithiobacillus concretivorus]MBU2737852.1 hypothetical protein [Acidithiobacillus concretivorus]
MIPQNNSLETGNSVKSYDRHLISAEKRISEKFKIKKRLLLGGYLLIGLFFYQGAMATQYATSFDCTTANTVTEQVICQDQKLASLDLQVSHEYDELVNNMKKSGNHQKNLSYLLVSQEKWKKEKIQCKDDSFCITDAYGKRLAELDACYH